MKILRLSRFKLFATDGSSDADWLSVGFGVGLAVLFLVIRLITTSKVREKKLTFVAIINGETKITLVN